MTTARSAGRRVGAATIANAPIYPVLISVAFILDVWKTSGVDPLLLIRPIVVAVLGASVLTAASVLMARDLHVGGALAAIVTIGVIGGDDLRIALLAVVAVVLVAVLVRRNAPYVRRVPWPRVTSLFNLVSVVMVALLGIGTWGTIVRTQSAPARLDDVSALIHDGAAGPDIVVLLLDGHGRQDVLEDDYGEDISEFVGMLEARGFDVSSRSRSNYMSTQQTLASMFNFRQLTDLDLPSQRDPAFGAALKSYLDHNEAYHVLKGAGYTTAAVTPGYDGVSLRSSDVFLDGGQVNELEASLITNSILRGALKVVAPDVFPSQIRERVRWNLTPGNWLPRLLGGGHPAHPFFLFVHVPSPHPPYLFDRDGRPTLDPEIEFIDQRPFASRSEEDVSDVVEGYTEQLAYIDKLAIAAIDDVIAGVPDDAVVIVMSDHGPDAHVDWDHLQTTDTHERFSNFFAARTPNAPGLFGDAPTPVNVFPTLLDRYLGYSLPRQPDTSFLGVPPRDELIAIGDPDAR